MIKTLKIGLAMLFILLLVAACSKEEQGDAPQPLPPKDNTEVEVEEEPEGEVSYRAPYTGVIIDEENTNRPVLATINNDPLARPQSGISDADIIYEFLAEGATTRLLALFQSELPAEIGPIRSSRDYFLHIAKGLDAFYVAHGYSPDALALLNANYVDHVNGMQHDGTLFKRSKDRRAPHNSYISNESIQKAMENTNSGMEISKFPPLSFHESINDVKIEDAALNIVVKNGSGPKFTSTYTYDEGNGTYARTVNDSTTIDKANDEEVQLANVIVIEANHRTIDAEGRQEIDIESGGRGLLFHAGTVAVIEWENIDGIITPVENGAPAKLVPGKTWIHVLQVDRGIDSNVSYTP